MRFALVIPACNAVDRGVWEETLAAVEKQDRRPDARIVLDSGSSDRTAQLARDRNWRVIRIRRKKFDHGLTRGRIVRWLRHRGFDAVVFMSQDVVLASPDALGKLVDYLRDHTVTGCYGRQIGRRDSTLGAWQRKRCYPDRSQIKTLADVPRLKLMTAFCSNAFAAWKTAEVLAAGNFPRAKFGEDMLLAAAVLERGDAIGYCAEAVAVHEHPETLPELFRRGKAVGDLHREHPELLRRFGRPGTLLSESGFRFALLPRLGAKFLGYAAGRFRDGLIPWLIFLLMWLVLLPAIVLYDFPQRDISERYAPMAEAFAAGEWDFAFHPRVTPLLTMLAGAIRRIAGCGGFRACQLAGALMITCGIFPLYRGCVEIYGTRVAAWTALLYAGCSSLLRLGYYGVRETCCVFGVTLLFLAAAELRKRPEKPNGYLVFAVAETILLLSRGDTALPVLAAFVALLVWDIAAHRHPLRSAGAAALILALSLPFLLLNYRWIGYPVPEVRHGVVLRALCRKLPALKFLENPRPRIPLDIGLPGEDSDE